MILFSIVLLLSKNNGFFSIRVLTMLINYMRVSVERDIFVTNELLCKS